ncbi:MAG: carboxypeptidase-like regulatory domain-containing protein [Eubacterium sp.]
MLYALVNQADDYDGSLYLMTCDVSPKGPGCDITGKITIATSLDGGASDTGISGINLTVKTADDSTVATAVTDSNGDYTLADIPAGEYKMLISGETTIDRTVTLVVSESKDVSSVSIAICDYNHDGSIDGLDKLSFYKAFSGGAEDYNLYCDFNKDNAIDGLDKLTFFTFFGNEVKYADVTLN